MHPQARVQGLFATELPSGEVVVYDADESCYHHLNPACAAVWRACDGSSSVSQLTTRLGADYNDAVVELALEELSAKNLIASSIALPLSDERSGQGIPRRTALQRIGTHGVAAMMLPVVTTLAMPRRGAAQAQQPMDSPETPPPTGVCEGGVTLLILKYEGITPLAGDVFGQRRNPQASGLLPAQNVGTPMNPRYQFAIAELGGLFDSVANGRLANDFAIFVGLQMVTEIHTSCSAPIFPGMPVGGGFVVTEVHSAKGGIIGAPAASDTDKVTGSKGIKK